MSWRILFLKLCSLAPSIHRPHYSFQLDSHTSPYKREPPPFTHYDFHFTQFSLNSKLSNFKYRGSISSNFLKLSGWEEQCRGRRSSKCTRNGKVEKQALNGPKFGLNLLTISSAKYPLFTISPEMANLSILISWKCLFPPVMVCISEVCSIFHSWNRYIKKRVLIWFHMFWFFIFHSDVINRLNCLRGKGMASMYSWSAKR